MKHKSVIFDMDGVLVDTEKMYQETWRELAKERNICLPPEFPEEISGTNGSHMREKIEKYYKVSDGMEIIEACMKKMDEKLEAHVPVKDGVLEILEYYKQAGIPMAVASSSSAERIEKNLCKCGIRNYFSVLVSGREVKRGKPCPDIFLLAAERTGCHASECIVYEDSKNGVKAGYAAGCCTIMIRDLIEPDEEMKRLCSKIYGSFYEVLKEKKD